MDKGKDGFLICRYRLIKATGNLPPIKNHLLDNQAVKRKEVTNFKLIRDSQLALNIKQKYDYSCQVCGIRLDCKGGPYAEAAHIKPLGVGHNGPDIEKNLLCLCPNHHVLFDGGAFQVNDDYTLVGLPGSLIVKKGHKLGLEYLAYHRNLWAI